MKNAIKISNAVIFSLLAFLGFSGCKTTQIKKEQKKEKTEQKQEQKEERPILIKYGMPNSVWKLS